MGRLLLYGEYCTVIKTQAGAWSHIDNVFSVRLKNNPRELENNPRELENNPGKLENKLGKLEDNPRELATLESWRTRRKNRKTTPES